ncbi:MAG: HAD family hydrolase [Gemmatimonadaceae bacterium]
MSAVRGVLFDMDGTLVDSNDAHSRAWVDAFREAGFDVPFQRIRELVGMGGDKIVPIITGFDTNSDEAHALGERNGAIFMQYYLPQVKPFPKVRELFEHVRDRGLARYIATSAKQEELKALLQIANVADLVSGEASKKDAEHSKPDPDIIDAAIKKSGIGPDSLVMVGDTPYDLEAASRAKMRSIAFRCGGWWPDDKLSGATQIYDGPWDMLDKYASFERVFEQN